MIGKAIAADLGIKHTHVRSILRDARRAGDARAAMRHGSQIKVGINYPLRQKLLGYARHRDVNVPDLVTAIIDAVVRDNLIAAVLDSE